MTIPGYDQDLMKGRNFQYHSVVEKKYYSLNLKNIGKKDSKIDIQGYKAVIDSGTSAIIGPADLISKFIEGISVRSNCENLNDLPDLIFTIEETEYVLEPQDYVLKVTLLGATQCLIGIMPAQLPPDFNYFILGDVFMRKYYTHFDKTNDRVGFYDTKKFDNSKQEK